MIARVAFAALLVLVLSRPAHAQWEEEDLWTPSATPTPVAMRKQQSGGVDGKFGVGIALGAPTGLTGKMRLDPKRAVDAAFAWDDGTLYLHSDYLFAGQNLMNGTSADVGWFVGIGGRAIMIDDASSTTFVSMAATAQKPGKGNQGGSSNGATGVSSNLGIGARVPAGLSLKFDSARQLELFAEIALDVAVVNGDGTSLVGAVGGRWFF